MNGKFSVMNIWLIDRQILSSDPSSMAAPFFSTPFQPFVYQVNFLSFSKKLRVRICLRVRFMCVCACFYVCVSLCKSSIWIRVLVWLFLNYSMSWWWCLVCYDGDADDETVTERKSDSSCFFFFFFPEDNVMNLWLKWVWIRVASFLSLFFFLVY